MITLRYIAIDGYRQTRRFKTLAGACKYAHERMGTHPNLGAWYAVTDDGVGTLYADGVTLEALFPPAGERAA